MLDLRFRALTVEAGENIGANLFIGVFILLVINQVFFFSVRGNLSWLLLLLSVMSLMDSSDDSSSPISQLSNISFPTDPEG